jgi:DNA-binding MarR family transcriptional regulator
MRSPNQLISSLSDADYAGLQSFLSAVTLNRGVVLAETGGVVERVIFPHNAIISLVVETPAGDLIETAIIGHDGVWGALCALDGKVSVNKALVQVPGAATAVKADDLRRLARRSETLQSMLMSHEQYLFAATQQTAACNAIHPLEQRLCRWLAQMAETSGGDEFEMTQEFLAQMLGVRRTSVSLVADKLQTAGLIKYKRGRIRIVDAENLRKGSCDCLAAVKGHYVRLLS